MTAPGTARAKIVGGQPGSVGNGMRTVSNLLIIGGLIAITAGLAARFGLLSWFGNLPGDIRRVGERSVVFIPLTSMLVVSVLLTLAVNLAGRFFRP